MSLVRLPFICKYIRIKRFQAVFFICSLGFLFLFFVIVQNWTHLTRHEQVPCHYGPRRFESLTNYTESKISSELLENYRHLLDNRSQHDKQIKSSSWVTPPHKWSFAIAESKDILVYSAYLEAGNDPEVLKVDIVGAAVKNKDTLLDSLRCILQMRSPAGLLSTSSRSVAHEFLPEDHDKPYIAVIITCHFSNPSSGPNLNQTWWIALGLNTETKEDDTPISLHREWIRVHVAPNGPSSIAKKSLAVCVRPLFGPFSSVLSLAEFLAYYEVMKVDKFYFYNSSTSLQVDIFFNLLRQKASHQVDVEVLGWNLPLSEDQIHSQGQLVHIHDCILRTRYHYNHILIVDLDEFLLPKTHRNIKDMIQSLDYGTAAVLYIPNVFYCKEFQHDNETMMDSLSLGLPLKTQAWHRRQATFWPLPVRSKLIINPTRVTVVGIHNAWKVISPYYEVYLPPSVAVIGHYRHCCGIRQPYLLFLLEFVVLSDVVVNDVHALTFRDYLASYSSVVKTIMSLLK